MRRHDEGLRGAGLRLHGARAWLAASAVWLSCFVAPAHAAPPIEPTASQPPTATGQPPADQPPAGQPPAGQPTDQAPACDPADGQTCDTPEPQTAGEWYARGIELGNAEDFSAAADAFLRSYALRPTPEALFNAALALENAGAALEAIANYQRFLAEPEQPPELVELAERSIDALTRTVSVLKGVRYYPERPPVEIYVNGVRVELDSFPLLLLPGAIELELVDEQGNHVRESHELLAGEALVIDLRALLPLLEPPPPEIIEDHGPTPSELEAARAHALTAKQLRTVTWGMLGLTGASALGAMSVALLAKRERRLYPDITCLPFENMICPGDFSISDIPGHRQHYTNLVISGTVLASVSGAAALTSLIVGLVSRRHQRASLLTHAPNGRANVRLLVGGVELSF